jgi:hypothetical protein
MRAITNVHNLSIDRKYKDRVKSMSSTVEQFYTTDEHAGPNPSLHEEDSPWKIERVMLLVVLSARTGLA